MIPENLMFAMTPPAGVNVRVVGSRRALLVLWVLEWLPRLVHRARIRVSDDRWVRILKWSLARVRVERQVVEGGAWVEIANGWDSVRSVS